MVRRTSGQYDALSISCTSRHPRRQPPHPLQRAWLKLITRAGLGSSSPGTSQPKSWSSSVTRFSTRPPYLVGCLVSIATSTRRS